MYTNEKLLPTCKAVPDFFTADSLQCVSTQPATVVVQYSRHAHETHAYLLTYFALTLSMYTLIPTVYRALLNSAVSGSDHRIHTTKESSPKTTIWFTQRHPVC